MANTDIHRTATIAKVWLQLLTKNREPFLDKMGWILELGHNNIDFSLELDSHCYMRWTNFDEESKKHSSVK